MVMSKMMRIFKTLREENETIMQLKGLCPDNKVPKGLLLEGRDALRDEVHDRSGMFNQAKIHDMINEKRPE